MKWKAHEIVTLIIQITVEHYLVFKLPSEDIIMFEITYISLTSSSFLIPMIFDHHIFQLLVSV